MEALGLNTLETEALGLSLRVALWCVALSLPPAIAVAWLLSDAARYCVATVLSVNGGR